MLILLIAFTGVRLFSSHKAKENIKNDTMIHLTDKGYAEADIENIQVVNIGGNELEYATVVTFSDEKKVDYLYTYNKDGQIIQFDYVNQSGQNEIKHIE